jgi:hypothetical protein
MPGTRVRLRRPGHDAIVPGIHALNFNSIKDVDGRDKPGHDDVDGSASTTAGMIRFKDQTLEHNPIALTRKSLGWDSQSLSNQRVCCD